jgi:integrase
MSQFVAVPSLLDEAKAYAGAAKAHNTRRSYASDWQHFCHWCDDHQVDSLPATAETVVLYITDLARSHKVATIQHRLVAISQLHQAARYDSPTANLAVRDVLRGIKRTLGTAPEQKTPVLTADLQAMLHTLPAGLLGTRDRALLLVGFAGAFRRSELVSLDVADLTFSRQGLTILLRRSKTDQIGEGRKLGVPHGASKATCPVRALQTWLKAADIADGPIFRPINRHGHVAPTRLSDHAVASVVKRCAAAADLDPALFAGHSLRAGCVTQGAMNGVEERVLMKQTGHKSTTMLRRYVRDADLFKDNAAAKLGL